MEENGPKITIKTVLITTLTITIIPLLIFVVVKLLNRNDVQAIPNETGAVASPLPALEKKSYDSLYNLMDRGKIRSDYFEIEPLYQDRILKITVKEPFSENKIKAEKWLKQNGYGDIPYGKIFYVKSP